RGWIDAGNRFEHGRLPRSVGTDHRKDHADRNFEIQIADGRQPAKPHRELVDRQEGHKRAAYFASSWSSCFMRREGSKPSGRKRTIKISTRPKIMSFQLLNYNRYSALWIASP